MVRSSRGSSIGNGESGCRWHNERHLERVGLEGQGGRVLQETLRGCGAQGASSAEFHSVEIQSIPRDGIGDGEQRNDRAS